MGKGPAADKFAERRSLVGRLFNLGISIPAIVTITGYPSVNNDLRSLRQAGTIFSRPDPEKVFPAILRLYARILAGQTEDADLKPYLHQWLKIDEVKTVIKEAEKVMRVLDQPQFTEQQERYHSFLISGIFGGQFQETPQYYDLDDYFADLVQEKIEPAKNFEALCFVMRSKVVSGWRHCIAPIWPDNAEEVILGVIKSLADEPKENGERDQWGQRQVYILIARFGLNGKTPLTLEELGRQLSISKDRVRQIEVKGLRRLRHPDRTKLLKPFLTPIGKMLDNHHLLPQPPITTNEELENKSVEELEISVRAAHALRQMNIRTIGELLAKDPQLLLSHQNWGKKSIDEVKAVLGSLGIEWGK